MTNSSGYILLFYSKLYQCNETVNFTENAFIYLLYLFRTLMTEQLMIDRKWDERERRGDIAIRKNTSK